MHANTGLVWFRNDLRVDDQISLAEATKNHKNVIGVYCFDPRQFAKDQFGFQKTAKFRAQFLVETVTALKEQLKKFSIPLIVYVAKPEEVLPTLINNFSCSHIYYQNEWTAEEVEVERSLKDKLAPIEITWVAAYDQFLFHPQDVPFAIENTPQVFTNFRKKVEKYAKVRSLLAIEAGFSQENVPNDTVIPSIKDLGFQEFTPSQHTAFPFRGGEIEANKRIENYFWQSQQLSSYKKTRNGLIGINYSSKLSAWLANGSISPRSIYFEVKKYEKEVVKNSSTYWLIFELIWRDYFKYISLKHGDAIFKIGGILKKEYEWSTDQDKVNQWINGQTGEAFVDANMVELKKTGWMSNRGRQNVASYFSKELQLDWRIGAAYFESVLLDYDVHSNYGNWMYVAGVGNDPRDRKFNIQSQAARYDPQQKFQQLWLQPTLF